MLTEVDVKKFASYNWGLKDGVEQGIQQGIQQGVQQGVQQGKLTERVRLAQQLIRKNLLSESDIAELTELSLAEIQKLRGEIHH